MNKIKHYIYYVLIGILSFLSLAFLPLIGGSSTVVGWDFPTSTAGWSVWVASRIAVSVLNILIFHCFIRQGDLNTKDNPDRLKAEEILNKHDKQRTKIPLSPEKFFAREYGKKIPTVFLMSVVSLIAFGPMLLVFDFAVFLSYLFTVIMAIVFGILEMKKVEGYFTFDLLKYAYYVEEIKKVADRHVETTQRLEDVDTISDSDSGTKL